MPLRSALLALAVTAITGAASAQKVDFQRDIRPILNENCFACHGFDEHARKADLRLDTAESAHAEREGVVAFQPGKPDESEAWSRIVSDEPDLRMPPPRSKKVLSDSDKAKLKAWIEQGASYAGLWSFTPPTRANVPNVDGNSNPNPIDAFVRARLVKEGLKPSPQADRYALIRRLALDLNGLPPSAAETEAFVRDDDPRAYERLVDRLLDSPHFGEKLALAWLDSARYADTNGFSIDGGRHMWLWRDWVIQAFNDNKPYNRFLIEQIAGDLLPGRTEADLIATGFQRNNMVTHEGGTIPEENLVNYNADRVKTLGEAVLGLTLGCAQCHSHKFDPITHRDYYQMFAFFNTLPDRGLDGNAGVNPGPSVAARTVLKTDELPELKGRIASLEAKLAQPDATILAAWEAREQERLARRGHGFAAHPIRLRKVSTPNRGAGFEVEDERFVNIRGLGDLGAIDVSSELPDVKGPITAVRVIVHPQPDLPGGGYGSGRPVGTPRDAKEFRGTFIITSVSNSAESIPADQVDLHQLMEVRHVTASSWDARFEPSGVIDPRGHDGWSPDPGAQGPVCLTINFAEPIQAADTPYLTTQLNFGYGQNLVAGRLELQAITGEDDGTALPAAVLEALARPSESRSESDRAALWKYAASHASELERTRIDLANARERAAVLTEPFTVMVMAVAEKPRATFILNRGDYSQPTDKVDAGVPAALPPLPAGVPADRLALARWVVAPENPLTSRVAVNRIWQMLFGTGLVATPADLGSQGEMPSHPELLDWLAVEFRERDWDVKALVRRIVTSETYRQTSKATPEAIEHDPANRLLARGPRFRLPAELIRDSALKTSGLLVSRIGGPSVNPYTPGDPWREISHYGSTPATSQTFVQDHGEKLYRRSLYTYWKRTSPPPSLTAFDAPNRETCTVGRPVTNTPLQALVTLNDPQFVEAARGFAGRLLGHPGNDRERLVWGVLEALSRPADDAEITVLTRVLDRERKRFSNDEAAAQAFLTIGESPIPDGANPCELAAWSQVATLLLNLSEFITRN